MTTVDSSITTRHMQDHSEDIFYLIDKDGFRRVPHILNPPSGHHGYAIHPRGKGNDKSVARYTVDVKEMVQEVVIGGKGVRTRVRGGPKDRQLNTLVLKGTAIRGYWLHPDHLDWVEGGCAPEYLALTPSRAMRPKVKLARLPMAHEEAPANHAVSDGFALPLPATLPGAHGSGIKLYRAKESIQFSDHCCQGNGGGVESGAFSLEDLTLATEGNKRLRFSPLGNRPDHPRIALVGITPGGQIEAFASFLSTMDVPAAASKAAFAGAQNAIKDLLRAHGLANRIDVNLDGDLNENHDILTTSIVKCCLMVDNNYRYAAPDIAASAAASFCATQRLVKELRSYPTLEWIFIFGGPGWNALQELQIDGKPIIDMLRGSGLRVVQLPHFSQNNQQRGLFISNEADAKQKVIKDPHWAKYAPAADKMREAVLVAMAAG